MEEDATPQPEETPTVEAQDEETGKTDDSESEAFRSLRKQNKKLLKRLSQFEQAKEEAEKAKLSEVERLRSELADSNARHQAYEDRLKSQAIRHAIEQEAAKQGAHYPADVVSLVDMDLIEFEDGKVMGAKKAVSAFRKSKAAYFGNGGGAKRNGGGNPPGDPPSYNTPSALDLHRMSNEDFDKFHKGVASGQIKL